LRLINDNSCVWINQLQARNNTKILSENLICDYLIVGAGYTGLSAARKLSEIKGTSKIIVVDAQLAGEGGSGRNSGYLVDTTLNDGFTSNKDINNYKTKTKIYDLGIKTVKKYIKEFQVDCDWNECGKYFASSSLKDEDKARLFSKLLNELGFQNEVLDKSKFKDRLGTSFYKIGVYTKGGILLNPAKLARSMIGTLPDNVELYENTELLNWKKVSDNIECQFEKNQIKAKKIIEKVKEKEKKLVSEQAPPKKVKKIKPDAVPMPEDKVKKVEKIKEDKQNPEKVDNEVKQVSEFEKEELFDPNNIAALIDKSKESKAETLKKNPDLSQDQNKNFENTGLSLSEEDALKAQIFGCWSIPLGLPYNENLLVRIKLELKPDGSVINSEILDHARMNKPGQGFYKVLAESALRAIKLCQPLRVPSTGYERWKELQLNFDAREMLEG